MSASEANAAVDVPAAEYEAYQQAGGGFVPRTPSGLYRHDGPDALDLLQRITTNDLASLTPGKARRTVIADDRGRVVDVPWVVMRDADDLLLVTDLRDTQSFERAILKYTIIEDACLTGMDGQLRRVALLGEGVESALQRMVDGLALSQCGIGDWVRSGDSILLRTSFGDMPAWELVAPASQLDTWLTGLGTELPLLSDETFQAIRIEAGMPWPGYELTPAVNPLECGLSELIDFDKGCYVGQEVIARLDTYDKVQRAFVKLRYADGQPADVSQTVQVGADLRDADGVRKVGWISSAAVVPTTGEWVGMGFARQAHSAIGSELTVDPQESRLVVAG